MKMIKEITLQFAIEMAYNLHKKGTSMALAIYKAAKYYQIDQRAVAVGVRKHTNTKKYILTHKQNNQTYWWDNG